MTFQTMTFKWTFLNFLNCFNGQMISNFRDPFFYDDIFKKTKYAYLNFYF